MVNWYTKEKFDRKEHNLYKSVQVVVLRYCKNIVAKLISYLKSATPFPKCYLHKEKWTFDS